MSAPTRDSVGTTHAMKVEPEPFQAMADGLKRFEFRRNDCGFRVGHWLLLQECESGVFSGRQLDAEILYMLDGPAFGVPDGYAVLSVRILRFQEGVVSPLVPFTYKGS